MIFLAGVHGAGKTTLVKHWEKELGIKGYNAGLLIEHGGNKKMPMNKEISNIDDNQKILEYEVSLLSNERNLFVLEGHLCLIDGNGRVARISRNIFETLKPETIWVLVDDADTIAKRNWNKSSLLSSPSFICEFQKQESVFGKEIADYPRISFKIINGWDDGIKQMDEFLKARMNYGSNHVINKT